MPALVITCYVQSLSQQYEDRLERVELYVIGRHAGLPKPVRGTRTKTVLSAPSGKYIAGLRTYPPTGELYVCPDLVAEETNHQIGLARILDQNHILPGQYVDVSVEDSTWTIRTAKRSRSKSA